MRLKLRVSYVIVIAAVLSITGFATSVNQEKTVEQSFKNIKVLQGLPESQMFSTMNFVRASLGVSCAYCHVYSGGDNWKFESDDKPTKQTARRMMQMVLELNKTNPGLFGTERVTCFTCHRGNTKPISLPSLPVPAPEGGASGLPTKATVTLPSAQDVIQRYVQAVGGAQTISKFNSRTMNGSLVSWDDTRVPLTVHLQLPNKVLIIAGAGDAQRILGFNGTIGWVKTASESRSMRPVELSRIKGLLNSFNLLTIIAASSDMTVTGKDSINGHDAFIVERAVNSGRQELFYFDVQTGLLVRVKTLVDTILARIPEQIDFSDYTDVGQGKLPRTIRSSFVDPWIGTSRQFVEIKIAPVDSSQFEPPANLK